MKMKDWWHALPRVLAGQPKSGGRRSHAGRDGIILFGWTKGFMLNE